MTKQDLQFKVRAFYNGALDQDKCLKLYELEFGYLPEIEENDEQYVNVTCLPENDDILNEKNLRFMKDLQESGIVNMFFAQDTISKSLIIDKQDASKLLQFYMKNYQLIYFHEECI